MTDALTRLRMIVHMLATRLTGPAERTDNTDGGFTPSMSHVPVNLATPPRHSSCPKSASLKLHLGCGSNLLVDWLNIDSESIPGTMRLDLTQQPLPFPDETVDCIFSEHFIEHITRPQAFKLFVECYRVLRADGVLRLSTPDLRKLVDEYMSGRLAEWANVGWLPATPCQLLNEGMRAWDHQFVYDWLELKQLLSEIGFSSIERAIWRQSSDEALSQLECRPYHGEIIVEATKTTLPEVKA